jgi:PAS domain S-box-containing protein
VKESDRIRVAEERVAFLSAAVESCDDAVVSVDNDGFVASWNRNAERLFGYGGGDVVGQPVTSLFPEHQRDHVGALLMRVREGEILDHLPIEAQRKDGMAVEVSLTVTPVFDATGHALGVSCVATDVTERQLAQAGLAASEARLRRGEALAHVGGWVWDVGSDSVQWSDELHAMHGLDPSEFDGTMEAHLAPIHVDDRAAVRSGMEGAVAGGRRFVAEYRIVRSDGGVRWMRAEAEAALSSSGAVVGLQGVYKEVTERREAEAQQVAIEREREAAEERRVADRKAANALRRAVELLVEVAKEPVPAALVRRDDVRLGEEIERIVASLSDRLASRRVTIDVSRGVPVRVDRAVFARLLTAFLASACSFSAPTSPIMISARREGDAVVISVLDRGPGPPPDFAGDLAVADLIGENERARWEAGSGWSSRASLTFPAG